MDGSPFYHLTSTSVDLTAGSCVCAHVLWSSTRGVGLPDQLPPHCSKFWFWCGSGVGEVSSKKISTFRTAGKWIFLLRVGFIRG